MKSAIRISALLWADILVGYALFVMQDYLTNVWGLSFTHAAAILNLWNGISLLLQPLFLFFIVDTLLGNFKMLVISSTSYTLGIFFVFMSAPPILAKSTGTCNQYEQECIGQKQKALFYTGMALIAVGVAGNNISVKQFLLQQPDRPDDGAVIGCLRIPGMIMVAVVGVTGAICYGLGYILLIGVLILSSSNSLSAIIFGNLLRKCRRQHVHNITAPNFRSLSPRIEIWKFRQQKLFIFPRSQIRLRGLPLDEKLTNYRTATRNLPRVQSLNGGQ